jgi:hypothetical protein
MKPAWPMLNCPAMPLTMLSDVAPSTLMAQTMAMVSQNL